MSSFKVTLMTSSASTSCDWYPIKLNTKIDLLLGTEMVNSPLAFVLVPRLLPFRKTLTPGNGPLFSKAETLPFTGISAIDWSELDKSPA